MQLGFSLHHQFILTDALAVRRKRKKKPASHNFWSKKMIHVRRCWDVGSGWCLHLWYIEGQLRTVSFISSYSLCQTTQGFTNSLPVCSLWRWKSADRMCKDGRHDSPSEVKPKFVVLISWFIGCDKKEVKRHDWPSRLTCIWSSAGLRYCDFTITSAQTLDPNCIKSTR